MDSRMAQRAFDAGQPLRTGCVGDSARGPATAAPRPSSGRHREGGVVKRATSLQARPIAPGGWEVQAARFLAWCVNPRAAWARLTWPRLVPIVTAYFAAGYVATLIVLVVVCRS